MTLIFVTTSALVLVLVMMFILSRLIGGGGGGDTSAITPATPPNPAEVPIPSLSPTVPVTPPSTSPAQGTTQESAQGPNVVVRFPLGERQVHDPDNDDRRAQYGEQGAHCFVGEVCEEIPDGAENLNDSVAGSASGGLFGGSSGSGAGSGSSGGGTGGSGSDGGGLLGGARNDSAEREAEKRRAQNAVRVPSGQRGPHCFVGEVCPPVPDGGSSGGGTRPGTTSGPTVPCGTLGVHNRVGDVENCVDGVQRRVGDVPADRDGLPPDVPPGTVVPIASPTTVVPPTFQTGGRCFEVIAQSGTTWTVRAVSCPR